jgi:prenyltransferase beta subunit
MTSPYDDFESTVPSGSKARFPKRVFCWSPARPLPRPTGRYSHLVSVTLGLLLVLTMMPGLAAAHDDAYHESVQQAASWLMAQQADDGGFPGFSGESDPSTTTDAVIALAAAQPEGVEESIDAALAYLGTHALVVAQAGPGAAAKLSLALAAAGLDPRDFEGVNTLSIVQAAADQGLIGSGPFEHALGMLALSAAGEPIPDGVIAVVRDTQGDSGGWAFDGATDAAAADTNTSALMVQALIAAGLDNDEAVTRGIDYLLSTAAPEGGFPYQPGGPIDANSTSLSTQALIAAGRADDAVVDSALQALVELQNESGSFSWIDDPRDENMFATLQAIPALAGQALPVLPMQSAIPAATPIASPVALLPAA